MKTIQLTPREYLTNFKKIAKFKFQAITLHGILYITAETVKLEELGY